MPAARGSERHRGTMRKINDVSEEKQSPPRQQVDRPPRYVVDGEAAICSASGAATGTLVDVSSGGLLILGRIPVSLGEQVEVRFTPQGYPEEISVSGRILRVKMIKI